MTRFGRNCLQTFRDFPISSPPSTPPITKSPFTFSPVCYPDPLLNVIHNYTNAEIVRYRITLPMYGYRGPLWPILSLNIIIIITFTGFTPPGSVQASVFALA